MTICSPVKLPAHNSPVFSFQLSCSQAVAWEWIWFSPFDCKSWHTVSRAQHNSFPSQDLWSTAIISHPFPGSQLRFNRGHLTLRWKKWNITQDTQSLHSDAKKRGNFSKSSQCQYLLSHRRLIKPKLSLLYWLKYKATTMHFNSVSSNWAGKASRYTQIFCFWQFSLNVLVVLGCLYVPEFSELAIILIRETIDEIIKFNDKTPFHFKVVCTKLSDTMLITTTNI